MNTMLWMIQSLLGGLFTLVGAMLGAAITHFRRHEYPNSIANLLLLLLAVRITYGRFTVLPA